MGECMPELPEVETIRQGLVPVLGGATLEHVEVLDPRLVMPAAPADVAHQLAGRSIDSIERRGKYLLLVLAGGDVAIHHLRMTGSFGVRAPEDDQEPPHVRLRYHTANAVVWYRDPRRFGTLQVLSLERCNAYLDARLGPEPLSAAFDARHLLTWCARRGASIKSLLLDQRVVAGIGNIYADEALFQARVHPLAPANRVSRQAAARLVEAIVDRLEVAIGVGGSTLRDYAGVDGAPGSMQDRFLVYGRAGEPCANCGRLLRSGRVGGRMTVWCAHCQKLPRAARD